MRASLIILICTALLLTACSAPRLSNNPTPTHDAVATQVSLMLTQLPTATPLPPSSTPAPTVLSIATVTPETTPTQAATETTVPTATTAVSGDPKDSLGEPVWETQFDSGKPFGVVENDNTRIRTENGALTLTGVNANGWLGWSLTFSQQPKDFYLDAVLKTQDCAGSDQYGLMFRAPDASAGYFFGVTCDGRYFLEANDFRDNGYESTVVEPASAPHFAAGPNQSNRLGVMAKGTNLSFYINGNLIHEVTDSSFQEKGYFGAFIAAHQTAGFTVLMDEISLWNLP